MENIFAQLLLVAGIHLLAVMSPGPDFLMISRNTLIYSRKTGIYSAVGLGAGILVHITYSLFGIALVISQSIVLFSVIKYLGAAYLMYIGIKSLRSKRQGEVTGEQQANSKELTPFAAVKMGFLTNVLNPKATLFFLALFTQVITPTTPFIVKGLMSIEMVIATVAWFSLVAILLSHKRIKQAFVRIQHKAERVFGVLLIALGVKVALGSAK
jgi:RhtB (resistance to homoserine/threonine) family protein